MSAPAVARQRVVDLLRERGTMTSQEIADALKMGRTAVDSVIERARASKPRHIYVARWEATGGPWRPVWAAGDFADALRPAPLTNAQVVARHYRKQHPGCAPRLLRPLTAMGHVAFSLTQPPARTTSALLETLRNQSRHAATAARRA